MTVSKSAVLQAATALAIVQIGEEIEIAKINVKTGEPVRQPSRFSDILPDAIEAVMLGIEKAEAKSNSPRLAQWMALP